MGEWQTVNEVIVRLWTQTTVASFTVARQWPCFLFKPPELQIWATIPSRGSVLGLHVKILGLEQILHAWWRIMSQEEPWSGRLNVILQPRALPRASGTAFQSFVAHIMPPSPVPCHHINMLPQSYHEYCRSDISTFLIVWWFKPWKPFMFWLHII